MLDDIIGIANTLQDEFTEKFKKYLDSDGGLDVIVSINDKTIIDVPRQLKDLASIINTSLLLCSQMDEYTTTYGEKKKDKNEEV